jgi:hypothetical protein
VPLYFRATSDFPLTHIHQHVTAANMWHDRCRRCMAWMHPLLLILSVLFSFALGVVSVADTWSKHTVKLHEWRAVSSAQAAWNILFFVIYFVCLWKSGAQVLVTPESDGLTSPTRLSLRSNNRGDSSSLPEEESNIPHIADQQRARAAARAEALKKTADRSVLKAQSKATKTLETVIVEADPASRASTALYTFFYGANTVVSAFVLAFVVFLYSTVHDQSDSYIDAFDSNKLNDQSDLDYPHLIKVIFLQMQVLAAFVSVIVSMPVLLHAIIQPAAELPLSLE